MTNLRQVAVLLAVLGWPLPSPSVAADLVGTWVGAFDQDSHDTTGRFRMILTIERMEGAEFRGTLDWPDNNDCRTAVEGSFDGTAATWVETKYLRGDDVVLGGLYIGRFDRDGRLAGTWFDPKYTINPKGPNFGTPGGSFVLQREATKAGVGR